LISKTFFYADQRRKKPADLVNQRVFL